MGSLLAAVLLTSQPGCHRSGPPGEPEPVGQELGFEVENQSSTDIVIYLIIANVSTRLGMVTTNGVLSQTLPWRRIGAGRRLRLRAEVVGSATRLVTDDLQVSPGQLVRWTLTPDLHMSQVAVY